MIVSIVIPCRNDFQYLPLVLDHYTEGIDPNDIEIIIVNDGSTLPTGKFRPLYPSEFKHPVKIINTPLARGVGYSFDRGISEARGDIIVISCNDVLVRKGSWLTDVLNAVKAYPDMLGVAASVGLNPKQLDIDYEKRTVRYGANLLVQMNINDLPSRSKLRENPNYTDLFKGKWKSAKESDDPYPISCAMGSMYFTTKEFFLRTGGWDTDLRERWQGHRIWGHLEPHISLKYWLCGGDVMVFPKIEVGHIFERQDPRHRYAYGARSEVDMYWNALWIAETMVIDDRLRKQIIDFLHPQLNLGVAKQRIRQYLNNVLKVRKENEKRFTHDFQWFLDRFGIILK